MEEKNYITEDAKETQKLGQKFAATLNRGDSVLLLGELGAGKTTFVQGAAKALSVKARITSPTYVLVRKHAGILNNADLNFYHIDLYRIEDPDQVVNLGLDEVFQDKNGVVFIEWGKKAKDANFTWKVTFRMYGKNKREVSILKINSKTYEQES